MKNRSSVASRAGPFRMPPRNSQAASSPPEIERDRESRGPDHLWAAQPGLAGSRAEDAGRSGQVEDRGGAEPLRQGHLEASGSLE